LTDNDGGTAGAFCARHTAGAHDADTQMYELHLSRRKTGISVRPDRVWDKMWRVHQGDDVSDIVNLSRAKDAAMFWLAQSRGRGLRPGEVVSWRMGESPPAAPYSGFSQRVRESTPDPAEVAP
jgi:hypothetical protein